MTRESISALLSEVREEYIVEALTLSPADAGEEPTMENKNILRPMSRRFVSIALAAALLLAIGLVAYAAGRVILKKTESFGGNATITQGTEDGEEFSEVYLHTEALTDPAEVREGRLIFTADGNETDITDKVSNGGYYEYEYRDDEGNTHYLIVGLNSEDIRNFGYAEFIKDPDGEWIGGYSARTNTEADGSTMEWLMLGKSELNIPW